MSRNPFGWSLPPGVTDAMIERHFGPGCPDCTYDQAIEDGEGEEAAEDASDACREDGGTLCEFHARKRGDAYREDTRD